MLDTDPDPQTGTAPGPDRSAAPVAPIAVSCGEPAGIGPELASLAWWALGDSLPFFWIGDPDHLPDDTPRAVIDDPSETARAARHGLPVWPLAFSGPRIPGTPRLENAPGVLAAIETGVRFVEEGAAAALTTLPIHKKALKDGAAFAFPGHTEFLAHLAGVDRVVMMLASDVLRVVPVTIHEPLARVPGLLTPELLDATLRITHHALIHDFGIARPRLAVAGLNPHAGEGGTIGREEIEVIGPALDRLRAEGMDVTGPRSADTMFHDAARATYDVAVCMYHDQALIPIKALDFAGGVNVTLGLPFIRTSPDHGTAFDIAGTGQADVTSTLAALRLARHMAAARAAHGGH